MCVFDLQTFLLSSCNNLVTCVFCRSDEAGRSGIMYVTVSLSLRGRDSMEGGSAHCQLCPEYARGAVLPAQPGSAADTPTTDRP